MLVMEFNPWNYDPQIKAFFFFLMSCLGPGILSHHSNRKVTKTLSFSIADTFFFFLRKGALGLRARQATQMWRAKLGTLKGS